MSTQKELTKLKKKLEKHSDLKRANKAKKYLKSPFKFYGVKTPTLRKIAKDYLEESKNLTSSQLTKLATALWQTKWHEEKSLAIILLSQNQGKLTKNHLPLLEKMLNEATGWDHLDEIALRLLSPLLDLEKYPLGKEQLKVWQQSDNFWVQRAALLVQIPQFRRGEGDKQLFFQLAKPLLNEKDNWSERKRFFLRKAIGWVLREMAKKSPESVYDFVKENVQEISGLTFREATRKLPEEMQEELKKIRR